VSAEGPFEIVPIGFVRCAFRTRDEVPVQGGPATIEVLPGYAPALDCLERASHVLVLAFLHEADRDVMQARPRKLDPDAPPFGVFASRSPARPNPVSVSAVPLLRIDGLTLHVDHLDLADGTPVIDIKTYSPGHDCVFAARSTRRVRPSALSDDRLAAFLEREVENHVGRDEARSPAARVTLAAVFVATRLLDLDVRDRGVSVRASHGGQVTDVLMGLLGATLAGGRIVTDPPGCRPGFASFEFRCADGRALRLDATERTGDVLDDPSRWMAEAFVRR
jgi:tRNA-Thr(GGU) m(6)t(6)A37 methyltransferase TsaA